MSGYLYNDFITYLYNNPLIVLIYSLLFSFVILFINKVKPVLYFIVLLIIVSLGLCLFTNDLLYFLIGIESYNILYLLLLYNTSQNNQLLIEVKKLALLSMIISSVIIFGITLIITNNGSFLFNNINLYNQLTILGLSFILIGVLFKLCVFPFHIWILDIYKKLPYYIVLISDCFFKLILLLILLRCTNIFNSQLFNNIFLVFGTVSMFLGIILSIKEKNIKRFIGLFNISHIGLILLLLSLHNNNKYLSVFGYLLMYSTCSLCLLLATKDNIEYFRHFKLNKCLTDNTACNNTTILENNNISKTRQIISIVSLLAMVCIPPFHTFLAKLDLILLILINEANKTLTYTVLILSTMYFILEIIVVMLKLRFIVYNISK